MIRIGRCIVIRQVASDACTGGIDIITLVAGNTIICNRRMCSGQRVIIGMDRECSRFPAWDCRMACVTRIRNIDGNMVGIGSLVIDSGVAFRTNRRCILVTTYMTLVAGSSCMGPGKRENIIVIESFRISCRMTCITGLAVINITSYPVMTIICFGFIIMGMAVDAGVLSIV
jgi:hypothetical protein